jgi:crossover junction endodeoxyribonuclease RuvC
VRILGIDPGYGIVGWAVVDENLAVLGCGSIETPAGSPFDDRLLEIHRALRDVIAEYHPDGAALERLFFSRNTTTAMDVAKAIGVIILTLRQAGISHGEYTPVQVKQAITGYGRASKEQIQTMISRICNINACALRDDVADAISIAACHSLACGRKSGEARAAGRA